MSRARRRYGVMTDRWGYQPFGWEQNELPSWRAGQAPAGLVTRRQMREAGLAPAAGAPVAQVVFTYRRREVRALLWDRTDHTPKRVPTAAQRVALGRAMAARRWCPSRHADVAYCISTAQGQCGDCAFPDTTTVREESRHAA